MATENVGGVSWYVDADTDKAVNSTKALETQLDKTGASFKQLDTKVSKTASSVNNALSGVGRKAGQAGIQLQQLIGQIQGGQDAMLALSAQGADLGFVLGAPLLGAVVGIGASLVGMLIPALMGAEVATEDLYDDMVKLNDEYDLTPAQIAKMVMVNQQHIASLQAENAELDKNIEKLKEKHKQAGISNGSILGQIGATARAAAGEKAFTEAVTTNTAQIDTNNQKIKDYEKLLEDLEKNQGIARKTIEETEKSLKSKTTALDRLKESLNTQIATMAMTERGIAHYKADMLGATQAMHDQIDALYDHKEALAADAEFYKEVTRLREASIKSQQREREEQKRANEQKVEEAVSISERGMSEAQIMQSEIDMLNQIYEQGILDKQIYNDAMAQLDKERMQSQSDMLNTALSTYEQSFSGIASVLSQSLGEQSSAYKAMFYIAKSFAIAQATLNLSKAVSDALAWGGLTPIEKFASAAAVGAAATNLLTQVSSVAFAGREHGGPMLANVPYEVGEKNKPELLMIPGNNGKMFSNSEVKSMMNGGGGGSQFNQQIITPPGYAANTTGDAVNSTQVVEIVKAQMTNSNSVSRRALSSSSNVTNKIKGGR